MQFQSELIDLHKDREKEILDTWLNSKGLDITIKPVSVLVGADKVSHDLDPFNIDIKRVGYENGAVSDYGTDYQQKAIFINEQFQFSLISYDILIDEIEDVSDSSNISEVFCFIGGVIVPKYSIITFKDFQNINLRVEEIAKKRPLSDVYRYKLVRC